MLRPFLFMILILSTSGLLQAQTITSAASGNWSDAATWVGGVVPVSGNNVTIPFGHTVTLTGAVNTGTGILTVNGTLALAGFDMTAGALVGSGNIGSASGTPTLTVGSNNTNDIWGGVYSGTGAQFTKVGTGTVFFSGSSPNTYTGATTINGGRVQIATANERISNSTDVFVASGAIFDLGGRTETVGSLAGAGTVTSTFNGGVLIVSGVANTTFSGIMQNGTSGTLALTKAGTGTLTLTGANTYTGATTISAGILSLGDGGTTGSVAGNVTNNAALIINRSNDMTFAGVISGTGTVTKQGAGTLTLTGANTYTGATTISAGTLSLGSGGTTGSIASASIVNNGALIFNRSNDLTYAGVISGTGTLTKQGAAILYLPNNNTYTGTTTISTGTLSFGNGGFTGTIAGTNIVNNAALVFNSQNAQTCSGAISGTGTLTYQGTNMLTLSGSNTYSGSTTINGGTLSISNDSRLGTAPASPTPGHLVFNGGSLNATANLTLSANRGITLNAGGGIFTGAAVTYQGIIAGTGGLIVNGGSGLTLSGANANTYTGVTTVNVSILNINADSKLGAVPGSATPGNIILNGGTLIASATFTLNANRGISLATASANTINVGTTFTLTYPGIIAGAGSLSKGSSGTLILSGANTYTGATTINAGTLAAAHVNALRSSSSVTVTNSTLRSDVALTLPPLTLSGTGATAGKMNCNGFNSTTGQLRLNTTWQTASGSYGSTTSGATNQNNTYFTGATGVLNVLGAMILEVVTTAPGQTVTLPLSGTVDVVVDWGDATTNTYTTDADVNKVYAAAGTYTITISGLLTQFGNGDNPDSGPGYSNPDKIKRVLNWGGTGLTSLFGAFQNTTNLVQVPSDFPANVVNVGWMFKNSNFNQPIGTWNMSNVQRMGHMFENNTAFNQDIGAWNVSNVWDMRFMFLGATAFNNGGSPSIGNWNTANLSRPRGMFSGCTSFDQNLGNWNTSSFFDLLDMFNGVTLSPCNYDATLIGWAAQTPDPIRSNSFNGGNSKYTAAGAAARATLSAAPSNWVFTDGGLIVPAGPASSTPTLPINTALPTITHITEGITGMGTPTGLPAGVTASWASNTITIIGTPTETGTFNYSIPLTGFCSSVTATGTITVTNLLPVRLLDFTAQADGEKVLLNWKTDLEQNNTGFDVERSADGRGWTKIGFVKGQINSSTLTRYSFTDLSPLKAVSFYRLRQVDLDGKFSYSHIARINIVSSVKVAFWPNPIHDLLNVEINKQYRGETLYLSVTDMNGALLLNRTINHGNSAFSTMGWSKGMYIVTLRNANGIITTQKIMKQ